MISLENSRLVFRFADVHKDAQCRIDLQRTLRIPDDNRSYPLPPGLGSFPLFHVDDFGERLPQSWLPRGGVFMPMYQSEALWINFSGHYPCAIKIAAGKINAVTGDEWRNELQNPPQDYVTTPGQPWLDGFTVAEGLIRQFVAMPLGQGFTAEGQLSGEEIHGGIQILVCPLKAEFYERLHKNQDRMRRASLDTLGAPAAAAASCEMGLAPGGLMQQHIYDDEHGIAAWDQEQVSRCFVHLLNSEQFMAITGQPPPPTPVSAKAYTKAGLPWFNHYAGDKTALKGSDKLAKLDSLASKLFKKSKQVLPENEPVEPKQVVKLGSGSVREGSF